jgi:hypothetical protein
MFSRILWRRLQDIFPEKRIEVVNIAMSAINSYTLLDFTDEILEYKPDLIIIYAGHNEYYGALGVGSLESIGHSRSLIKIYMKTQHLRLFRLLRELINRVMSVFRKDDASNPEDLTATLMERIVSEQVIPLGSKLYELGKEQFRSNLEEILRKAGQANVRRSKFTRKRSNWRPGVIIKKPDNCICGQKIWMPCDLEQLRISIQLSMNYP